MEVLRSPENLMGLDRSDRIDELLDDFYHEALIDHLPPAVLQDTLIVGVKHGDEDASRKLVRSHSGMVAAVAHAYKGGEQSSRDLLITGASGLLKAARTYKRHSELSFTDYAILAIDAKISESLPGSTPAINTDDELKPMEQLFKYMEGVQEKQKAFNAHYDALEGFTPLQKKVLLNLTLSNDTAIAEAVGTTQVSVSSAVAKCIKKVGVNNKSALAVEMQNRGLIYELPELDKPLVELLSEEELFICTNLGLKYKELAKATHNDLDDIRWKVDFIKRKTGARSRVELAVLVAKYDTGERHSPENANNRRLRKLAKKLGHKSIDHSDVEYLLEQIPESQRAAVEPYYLSDGETSWRDVGKMLNVPENAARTRAKRGIRNMRLILDKM